jgi:hypothetical protein
MSNSHRLAGLCAAALAALPATAFAQAFDGPYVAADGGLAVLSQDRDTIAGSTEDTDYDAAVRGAVGYRTTVGGVAGPVLGVEADIGSGNGGGDLRYGVSGIGGVQIGGSSLVYGRVGYAWLDGIQRPGGEGIHGPAFGGGFETRLVGNAHLRFDYRHVAYKDYDFPDNSAAFSGDEVTGGVVFAF